ncbi:Proton myo-inositol cotransporter [Microtus ochrogaster]|uniref:Proton myo-inositol cotransporter n=1 Tax=Microtus ochrogaster TaxID=79684 RepID=A0A8J6FW60_MICOH|nr:Proton myo-inositol cotransporter [Microtus ochrogaster]
MQVNLERQIAWKRVKSGASQGSFRGVALFPQHRGGTSTKVFSVLVGLASMTVPVYIAEVSPPNLRGRLVTINTLFITGGQFFASVVDGAFSYLQKNGWSETMSEKEEEEKDDVGNLEIIVDVVKTQKYYSATILQMSGVEDDRLAIWLASVTAFTNFIFTLVGVWLVEKVGRRKLTFGSLAGTTVALIILALGFLLSAQVSPRVTFKPVAPSGQNVTCTGYSYCNECMLDPDCGFCYKMNNSALIDSSCVPVNKASTNEAAWGRCDNETRFKTEDVHWAYSFCPTPYSWTALLGLVLYLIFFAPGAFFLYAGFAAVGLLFVYGCLPETKGKKLEEIESLFDNRLCPCGASDSDEGRYIEYIRVKGSNYHLSDNDASDVE